mmetsp:Transcript_579/g.735  ORF Transcript_579/g.735 Transcript_579/m.735 type:complete len:140 (-) Transcript_579:740-1159(-)
MLLHLSTVSFCMAHMLCIIFTSTCAFIYRRNSDFIIVNPALHPAPESKKAEIQSVFSLFIRQAQDIFASTSVWTKQVHLFREPYRFYASISKEYDIYILCSSKMQTFEVEDEVQSIVSKLTQQFQSIQIFNKGQTTTFH